MNCACNQGCGCSQFACNPFGCGGCSMNSCGSFGGCNTGTGCNWFAIVLVVFLLLIICGNSRIRP